MTVQIPLSQTGDAAAFKARVVVFDHHGGVGKLAPREDELVDAAVRCVPRSGAPDDDAIVDLTQDTVAGFTPAPFPET